MKMNRSVYITLLLSQKWRKLPSSLRVACSLRLREEVLIISLLADERLTFRDDQALSWSWRGPAWPPPPQTLDHDVGEMVTAPQDSQPSGPGVGVWGPEVRHGSTVVGPSTKRAQSPALVGRATWHPGNLCGFSREAAAAARRCLAEAGVCISLSFQPAVSHLSWLPTSNTQHQKDLPGAPANRNILVLHTRMCSYKKGSTGKTNHLKTR